ncbi:hypothetical protein DRE_04210 [Drechslerella stenobrocha 248]|uniref:SHSP domain-containing protein n=1 Tax=Drechslerella stenobrocha 248 TaxID=1043628 RepID=W7I2C4_9PEZI|nr:hypothetical protein DRE_04210 [Drechslerella stenobrocha 248]
MLSFPRMLSRDIRPWVRLFEDLETRTPHHSLFPSNSLSFTSSFSPSFDVKETKDSYVLDGEVPGINDKSALDLSFVDANTLVIKGHIERSSETGKPAAVKASEDKNAADASAANYHTPTVEEEGEAPSASALTKEENTATEVEKHTESDKYWVRERYVGEFQRAFSFPQSVDHDAVKASLKDGILSIVVPKRTGPDGPRKINIE